MKHSLKVGFTFGVTSGIITTLGLLVGLHSGTHSKIIIIGGILVVAVADAFSDAMGIHISEESENVHTRREIWESTISTFLFKFLIALTFIVPILLFNLLPAIIISVMWGLFILGVLSYRIAKEQKTRPWKVVVEHLLIATLVIIVTHYIGDWVEDAPKIVGIKGGAKPVRY
ncbi:hypothetical protein MYX76_14160, partial [Desulfobacterota bacterium AH_259_B03_O07]|nr:hypothetical protein [Desulfobacterota bacterium AH_259_B03_O07]